mmetsp:Transcript_24681/g.64318  ORF Transcript_24681/g.64318 Transcript_24681/m.64318 type:complete len:90 (+) Transcript_24681:170-439(+)
MGQGATLRLGACNAEDQTRARINIINADDSEATSARGGNVSGGSDRCPHRPCNAFNLLCRMLMERVVLWVERACDSERAVVRSKRHGDI